MPDTAGFKVLRGKNLLSRKKGRSSIDLQYLFFADEHNAKD